MYGTRGWAWGMVLCTTAASMACVQGRVSSQGLETPDAGATGSPTPTSDATEVGGPPASSPTPTVSPTSSPTPTVSPGPTATPTPTPTPGVVTYPPGAAPVQGNVTLPGLRTRVFLRGNDQTIGDVGTLQNISDARVWMASVSPNFTFLDQHVNGAAAVHFSGIDNTPLNTWLAPDGVGPVTRDANSIGTLVIDWTGYVHIPGAGNYNFTVDADDAVEVYLYGDPNVSGSGTLINRQNFLYNFSVNGNGVVTFGSDGNYTIELFWYNRYYNGSGNAYLDFSVTGPGTAMFYTPDTVDRTVPAAAPLPTITLGMPQVLPIPMLSDSGVYNYANDSVFPWLPSADGNAMLMFYVDGAVYRSRSPDVGHFQMPSPPPAVLAAGGAGFDANGTWLMNAIRKSDGTLVGLYHAEDHTFASGQGEWNTAGIALSTDDGNTWIKSGQIVGIPKPSVGAFGGREVTCMVWDPNRARFIGVGHGLGFVSSDPNAAPGTWFGYHNGVFDQPEPDTAGTNTPDILPGLTSNMGECKMAYSTYLQRYVLLWRNWGGMHLNVSVSDDGVTWTDTILLYDSGDPNLFVEYAQFMGPTDVTIGQDTWLLYEQRPSVTGRFRDMVVRAVHFE